MLTNSPRIRILTTVKHHNAEHRANVFKVWAAYWRAQLHQTPRWDFMCELIHRLLTQALAAHGLEPKRFLEAGCGTGRVSHRLAEAGIETHLIDRTPEAISLSRSLSTAHCTCHHVLGSCCQMPYASDTFDLVFNEGVLEHLPEDDQREFLAEMIRVVRPGGLVVTMNPYAYSWLYRLGKAVLEAIGRWPYGYEEPVRTLRNMVDGATLVREYSGGFLIIVSELFSRLLPVRGARAIVHRFAIRAYRARAVRALDALLARLFGGYLLVSVFRKHETPQ